MDKAWRGIKFDWQAFAVCLRWFAKDGSEAFQKATNPAPETWH